MLSGHPPFNLSIDPIELIYKHMVVTPKPLFEIRSDVGKALSDVVAKLLKKNAEDRYQGTLFFVSNFLISSFFLLILMDHFCRLLKSIGGSTRHS